MDERGTFLADVIQTSRRAYAAAAAGRQLEQGPQAVQSYGRRGFDDLVTDNEIRLNYLCQALATGRPELLDAHVAWLKASLAARGLDARFVAQNLQSLRDALEDNLPASHAGVATACLDRALGVLDRAAEELPTFLPDGAPNVELARRYLLAALEGRDGDATQLVLDAADDGVPIESIYVDVLQKTQAEIGRMWQIGDLNTAEEHLVSRTAEKVSVLLSHRVPRHDRAGHIALLAAVGGDLHDIGLRMIAHAFERSGWRVVFLGANSVASDVVRSVADFDADLLAVSGSLALHVRAVADLIAAVREDERSAGIPILVGGKPFNDVPDLWQVVGADGCGHDGDEAIRVAERLVADRAR